ncbi:hypothetical protein QUF70_20365 [Desulfobacterales bacterium HSG17]|nr:hypothetical protein [Desulfobacterales bacterium HSG17]
MRAAIAIWQDRISPVFDVSRKMIVLDIENHIVAKQSVETFENDHPMDRVAKLKKLHIETLICGAISNPLSEMITLQDIDTISFTCGPVQDVINAFLKDALPNQKLSMPGCCGFRKRVREKALIKKQL